MVNEFKKFALRGSVIELAIGVIIGAAFGKIVTSLVDDVIMPPIGVLLSQSQAADLQNWCLPLSVDIRNFNKAMFLPYATEHKIPTINFGRFLNNVTSFLIISFSVFLMVKQINRFAPPVPKMRACPECTSQIPIAARRCPQCT
jgi:large conductance mechanosensitive channel